MTRRQPAFHAEELALRAARVYLQMIFQDGFYHADPHPGNYLVLPGGVLGILDAGMVGRLDEDLRDRLEALIVAVYHRDAARLTETLTALGASPPPIRKACGPRWRTLSSISPISHSTSSI